MIVESNIEILEDIGWEWQFDDWGNHVFVPPMINYN